MYVNGKMISVETIPVMEGRGIHCKNFCECHNIFPPSNNKKRLN
jgi:hypothetical protein